jgi:hypothetical protein
LILADIIAFRFAALGEEMGSRIGPRLAAIKATGVDQPQLPEGFWRAPQGQTRACAPAGLVARIGPPRGPFVADSRFPGMLP